jgi:hypothetical protein
MQRVTAFRLHLAWFAGLATLAAATAAAAPTLTPYQAEYKVKISVLGGKLTTRLDRMPTGYRAESSIEATGLSRIIAGGAIRENSEFQSSPEGIRPLRFQSSDTLSSHEEFIDFAFEWDAGEIVGTINGEKFETDLDGIVHDRVSLQYGLMQDLLNGIHRTEYALQDAEKFKPLQISNIGSKTVKVPFGTFEVIGIQHRTEGSSRVTTLWCAEKLGFLPVIIEQHRDGKLKVRATLTEYTPTA